MRGVGSNEEEESASGHWRSLTRVQSQLGERGFTSNTHCSSCVESLSFWCHRDGSVFFLLVHLGF